MKTYPKIQERRSEYHNMNKVPVLKKKEPLEYLIGHAKFLFGHKLITPVIYFVSLMKFVLTMLSALDFIINGQFEAFFKKYSMSFCMSFYVLSLLAFVKLTIRGPKVDRFTQVDCFWDIETATLATQKKVDQKLRKTFSKYNFGIIWILTLALLSIFTGFSTDSHFFPEKIYVQKIFASFPKIEFILLVFVIISHALFIILTTTNIILNKYAVLTINIQLYLLTDFLNQIRIYETSDDVNIGTHLKICCTQHILIYRFIQMCRRVCFIPILMFVSTGILTFLGYLVFIYYSENFFDTIQVLGILALGTFLLIDICNDGQNVKNDFELFSSNLMNTKWYEWNEVNKKILLLMIVQSQKSVTFEALNIQVDRTLMIRVLKTVYQIFLIIQSTM